MIAIADSGSTNTDWVLLDGNTPISFTTKGLNPYFHDETFIADVLRKEEVIRNQAFLVTEVHFYGAGSSTEALKAIMSRGLQAVFPHAQIEVQHDLDGSALATCHDQPGIACILGTGSNSCFYDGKNIHEEVPSLAHVLGDEGSGSHMGKQLIRDFFYKKMPEHISNAFFEYSGLTSDKVISKVYQEKGVNVYLASLSHFFYEHIEDPYAHDLVYRCFSEFIDIHVKCYTNWQKYPVHFVGSIAWYFKDILREVLENEGGTMGVLLQKPIVGLQQYFMNR